MKQNLTPSSDSVSAIETVCINKSNLTDEEYALLQKLAIKSRSNFKQDLPKILTPIHGYEPFSKEFFTTPMKFRAKDGCMSVQEQYYKANLLHDSAADAREAFDKRYILGMLNYLSRSSAEQFNPWDGQHKHFFIAYKPGDDSLVVSNTTGLRTGVPYFASFEAANEAITIVGAENIKKILSSKF